MKLSTIIKRYKMRVLLLFCTLSLLTFSSEAQNTPLSPYSRFGVGDIQPIKNARSVGIGGLSVAQRGPQGISGMNPASYMNLDTLSVIFDLSLQFKGYKLEEEGTEGARNRSNANEASLGSIHFSFPITSWLKSGFGLMPTSNMGYDVMRKYNIDTNVGNYLLNHSGKGGLNRVYIGLSTGLKGISIGANLHYNFGYFDRSTHLLFADTLLLSPSYPHMAKLMNVGGLSFDIGAMYTQALGKNYNLTVGLTYTPSHALKASRQLNLFSLSGSGNASQMDTISIGNWEDGKLRMPDVLTVGLTFEKNADWMLGAEYKWVQYKKYSEFGVSDPRLVNAWKLRIGGEVKGKRLDNNFFNRMSYRVGYHYGTEYLMFGDGAIKEFAFSLGFGIPIKRTYSRIDVAAEVGRKGNMNLGQIQETYGRIVIGISAFDYWFMRSKFD